jgi:hypothetical protein
LGDSVNIRFKIFVRDQKVVAAQVAQAVWAAVEGPRHERVSALWIGLACSGARGPMRVGPQGEPGIAFRSRIATSPTQA